MSDSDSNDSDEGIRYKTESVRNKKEHNFDLHCSNYTTELTSPKHKKRKNNEIEAKYMANVSHKFDKRYEIDTICNITNDNELGPSLPPNFIKPSSSKATEKEQLVIGPALPLDLLNRHASEQTDSNMFATTTKQSAEDSFVGPQLPPDLLKQNNKEGENSKLQKTFEETREIQNKNIGPTLPPNLSQNTSRCSNDSIGPQFPPHLSQKNENEKIVGPKLPPGFQKPISQNTNIEPTKAPYLSQNISSSEDEDDECYGPLPIGMKGYSEAHQALEERALQLKIDQLDPQINKEPVREIWMLELPEAKAANIGLGPRQFRRKQGPDMSDRSSWTDTPNSKNKTEKPSISLQQEAVNREVKKRDKEQELMAKKHNKRDKSLVKMHQDKLNQQKKQSDGPSERRPFSRDIDLQVNRFDEAQKKAVLKKAQLLDDRFSAGKAKYL